MSLPTPKEIKALAKACRDSGITAFEGGGIKFTVDVNYKPSTKKQAPATSSPADLGDSPIESDELGPDALLFWSTPNANPEEGADQ